MTTTTSVPDILIANAPLGRSAGQPTSKADLPEALLKQIHDPSVLEGGLPYLGQCWASTDHIDTYHTRMQASSLKNFAADATAGVSVQDSHRVDIQPYGRTFQGKYVNGTPARTEVGFYIPSGLMVGGTPTDSVISSIRWGTAKDVSVGFFGGSVQCSLCKKPMLRNLQNLFAATDDEQDDGPCRHLPGVEYNVRKTKQTAIGEINNARLAEISLVFDGATPMSMIRSTPLGYKAEVMAEMDMLPRRTAEQLEVRYRMRFPGITQRSWAGWSSVERKPESPAHTTTALTQKPKTRAIPTRAYKV